MSLLYNDKSNSYKDFNKNKSSNKNLKTIPAKKSNLNNKIVFLNKTNENLNKSFSQSKISNYKFYI